LLILAITPIILATTGFVVLPSSVFAYIKDGKEVFIGSYMIFTFAIANTVLSFFGITYLRRVKKKFNDENYPMGVTVVAFINLLISIMCNYFTFSVLKLMLKNSKMEFKNISESLRKQMLNYYKLYENFDFDNIKVEKINGNKFYYDKRNLKMTEKLLKELEMLEKMPYPQFIELIDGEVVFS